MSWDVLSLAVQELPKYQCPKEKVFLSGPKVDLSIQYLVSFAISSYGRGSDSTATLAMLVSSF